MRSHSLYSSSHKKNILFNINTIEIFGKLNLQILLFYIYAYVTDITMKIKLQTKIITRNTINYLKYIQNILIT